VVTKDETPTSKNEKENDLGGVLRGNQSRLCFVCVLSLSLFSERACHL
jgi:hypothetical protein